MKKFTVSNRKALFVIVIVIAILTLYFGSGLQTSTTRNKIITGPIPPPGVMDYVESKPLTLASSIPGNVILEEVPVYIWHHGCGPTATAMVLGYYDNIYDTSLLSGDPNIQASINNDIASSEHYDDYCLPMDSLDPSSPYYSPEPLEDKSSLGSAHQSNCIADFRKTSWSSEGLYYGWSWFEYCPGSIEAYASYRGYDIDAYIVRYEEGLSFQVFKAAIDANMPVLVLVDTDGNGVSDHLSVVIGYSDVTKQIGVYTTWNTDTAWFYVRPAGINWGIIAACFTDFNNDVCFRCNGTIIETQISQNCQDGWYPYPPGCLSGIPGFELSIVIVSLGIIFYIKRRKE